MSQHRVRHKGLGQIQAALRWASAEALAEYKQINAEVYGGWILGAEKQKLTGLRAAGLASRARHDAAEASRLQAERDAACGASFQAGLAQRSAEGRYLAEACCSRSGPQSC